MIPWNRFILLLVIAGLFTITGRAQAPVDPPAWWINTHAWDPFLPWRFYITESSGYMGPNALPVPESSDAIIPEHPYIRVNGYAHMSLGDWTFNPLIRVGVPFGRRVIFETWYVPIEYFQTDVYTRDIRYSLGYEGKGWAKGDVYFSTGIQLLKAEKFRPDLHMRAAAKTASGEKYEEARYTDAPAYYFDLTAGWDWKLGSKTILRPFASTGFYCWQINHRKYYQDDALMYSTGVTTTIGKNRLKTYLAGYSGYLNNGDRPFVFRADYSREFKSGSFLLHYEFGIRDVYFDTYSIGYQFTLKKINSNDW